ncbi:MAG: glycerol-3-phosphate 1-O-acyltransferase PlsY [Desulfobacterales bacterium]|jgi:glycerol-3-phosphate acyltransferase PlsY|nr:glycerol-3-phosphate 1-O-acyltransferase PlsY [Desulfobacterales bacterium]
MHHHVIIVLGLLLFAYLLGSIPFGLILVKLFKSTDIREVGSGNIGATNVRRAGGWGLAVITLACDILKGAVPVYLAGIVAGDDMSCKEIWVSLVALSAFCGHLFPVYLKFKTGGKGVATAAGCFAVLSWPALAISLLVFILAVMLSKRVSMGSLSAAAVLPAAVMWAQRSMTLTGCALIISALVIYRHRDNIRRLLSGAEPPLWGK